MADSRRLPAWVTVETPARLAISLLDMNGELGRIDGCIGVAIDDPGFLIRARRCDDVRVESQNGVEPGMRATIERIVERFRGRFSMGGVEIDIRRSIPSHSGLGSGTQLSLAVLKAMACLYGVPIDTTGMASLAGRGGTSGIGVAAFDKGGFIVDGGHRFGGPNGKREFVPTSAAEGIPAPPVLFRMNMPSAWRIVVAVPRGRKVHSTEEKDLFRSICPLPRVEMASLAHVTLLKILPALLEADIDSFGEGIEMTQELGLKKRALALQADSGRATINEMRAMGLRGVGMSSWGPALFGFTDGEDADAMRSRLSAFLEGIGGGTVTVTAANESGARVKEEEQP